VPLLELRDTASSPIAGSYILFVGDLKPHKNVPVLMHAYAHLPAGVRSSTRLVIVGDGPEKARLHARASELGIDAATAFLGHVPDRVLTGLYSGAAAVVLPSLAEGFGLPVLEAMSRGVPVVVSDVPALRETTADAGLRFDPRKPESLAAVLVDLLSDSSLRAEYGRRGRERAAAFSWERTAELTEAAYLQVLQSSREDRE
jgi:glycosyltransferase involved in cell wall biosynthesis